MLSLLKSIPKLTLRLDFVLFILFCVSATLFDRGVDPLKPNRFGFPTILFVSFLVRGSRGVPVKIRRFNCWIKHQIKWKQERLVVDFIVNYNINQDENVYFVFLLTVFNLLYQLNSFNKSRNIKHFLYSYTYYYILRIIWADKSCNRSKCYSLSTKK